MRKRPVVRRRRRRREPLAALAVVGAAAVLLLGGLTWARGVILPVLVRTVIAEAGVIEKALEAEVAVIRQETVYVAALSGRVRFLAGEGERVRTGTPVVEIANPTARKSAEDRLLQVEAELAEFDRQNASARESLHRELSSIGMSILAAARSAQQAYSSQNRAAILQAESDLAALMDRRAAVMREIETIEQRRRDIEAEVGSIRALLEKTVNTIESGAPGIVSYVFDGCEKEFAWDRVRDVTARSVFLAEPKARSVVELREIIAGEPVFKLIQTDRACLAAAFPSNRVTELGGATARVRMNELGENAVDTRVVRLDTGPPGGYALAVLEMDRLPEQLLTTRKTRASIITRSTEGVVIPASCVATRNGSTGVYIVFKTMAQWKPVEVKARNGVRVVVDGISPGSEVVLNPWLVREGRQVK